MKLVCKVCGEEVWTGRPLDANMQMPSDRKQYCHKDRTALCPEVGIMSDGESGYIPTLPIPG